MTENTKTLIAAVVMAIILFGYWAVVAAMANWSTRRAVGLTQPPPGFELECVDNPDQTMLCKAYCGEDYPRSEGPHP